MPKKVTKIKNTDAIVKPEGIIVAPAVKPAKPVVANKSKSKLIVSWIAIAAVVMAACYALTYGGGFEKLGMVGDQEGRRVPGMARIQKADVVARDRSVDGNIIPGRVPSVGEEPLREPSEIRQAGVGDASQSYRESGMARVIAGDVVGALNDFTIAVERNPGEPINWIFRGEILMAGDNFEAAIADFNNAARLDPFSIEAYYNRALANIRLERLEDARTDLDLAVNARTAQPNRESAITMHAVFARRAQVNLWLRNWAEAEQDYTSAIAQNLGLQDWNDFVGRAEARTSLGKFEAAINDYVSAVTIISEKIQQTPMGSTRESMSRQAMSYFEKSAALRLQLGQRELALQDLEAALTLADALGDVENSNRFRVLIVGLY